MSSNLCSPVDSLGPLDEFDDELTFRFQKTFFDGFVTLFLIVFSCIRLYRLHKLGTFQMGKYRWSRIFLLKVCASFLVLVFQVIKLVRNVSRDFGYSVLIDVHTLVAAILTLVVLLFEHLSGKRQGKGIRIYWVLQFTFGAYLLKRLLASFRCLSLEAYFYLYIPEFLLYCLLMFCGLYFCDKKPFVVCKNEDISLKKIDKQEKDKDEEEKEEVMKSRDAMLGDYVKRHFVLQSDVVTPSLEETTPWYKRIFFTWIVKTLRIGYKRPLEETDLHLLLREERPEVISKRFHALWLAEVERSKNSSKGPSLIRVIRKMIWKKFLFAGFLKLIHDSLQFVSPLLIKQIIAFLSDDSKPLSEGIIYALLIFVAPVLQSIIIQNYFLIVFRLGVRTKLALITNVYQKAFTITPASKQESTTGQIVNLQSIDAEKFVELLPYLHIIWSGPFQIIVSLVFLYILLGWPIFTGFGVLLIVVPLNTLLMKRVSVIQRSLMKIRDEGQKLILEALEGIRIIKFFAWSRHFMNNIQKVRLRQEKRTKDMIVFSAISTFFWGGVPIIISAVTFITYALVGNILTAEIVFPALALMEILRFPMIMLPMVFVNLTTAKVSAKRILDFLVREDIPEDSARKINPQDESLDYAFKIEDGQFKWNSNLDEPKENLPQNNQKDGYSESSEIKINTSEDIAEDLVEDSFDDLPTLDNVSITFEKGKLYAVVGEVGCGKSSLLMALLGEIPKKRGEVIINGSVAYVGQQAWISNASIVENVVFSQSFDPEKYKKAVEVCQLDADISIFPDGELTEIGERGINLSGGQKQRVSLARAVYSGRDNYLLDDPLSAVDSGVGKKIFRKCIKGHLAGKTRILVTHQLQYLHEVDKIIVIHNGAIVEMGTYDELMDAGKQFASLIEGYSFNKGEESKDGDRQEEEKKIEKTKKDIESPASLVTKETKQSGKIKWYVYRSYGKALGGFVVVGFVLFLYVMDHTFRALSRFWVALWSDDPSSHSNAYWMSIYAGLGIVALIFVFAHDIVRAFAAIRGGTKLHKLMLRSVFSARVSFFDTTPIGRILNRFSKDQFSVDMVIPRVIGMFLNTILSLLSILFVVVIVTPMFLVFILPITKIYVQVRQYYVTSSRELNRLDSLLKSPVYSQFSETLNGITTLRAYDARERFTLMNEHFLDMNQRAYMTNQVANKWLANVLEFIGAGVIFLVSLLTISQKTNPGIAGVSLVYAVNVTSTLNWMIRMSSEFESHMVAVERIAEYSQLDSEDSNGDKELVDVDPNWPQKGSISVKNLSMRYRRNLDLVLNNLSFDVKPGEKIGVCGRTGCGKSSLMICLFRMVDPEPGSSIEIDNVDILNLNVNHLRSQLSIIPQDPVLFLGTIRSNLDPLNEYSDKAIWDALAACWMSKSVKRMNGKLEAKVEENGENLSVGQRQLICLGRSLLRKSKILVMDEATAAVDYETDSLIQKTIRTEFKDSTILTIAHRINTIMDYDRILVLDKGEIREFDKPDVLLKDENGLFSSMVKEQNTR